MSRATELRLETKFNDRQRERKKVKVGDPLQNERELANIRQWR